MSSRERQEFHKETFLKIPNFNQKFTIPSLNMSIEHRKSTNQKRVEKAIISDFVETNGMNFVEKNFKATSKKVNKIYISDFIE